MSAGIKQSHNDAGLVSREGTHNDAVLVSREGPAVRSGSDDRASLLENLREIYNLLSGRDGFGDVN